MYRRRGRLDEGHYITANITDGAASSRIIMDNTWVVPYNAVLLRAFDAHINVEICSSVKSIKYVCKYINKGSDMATIGIRDFGNDEIFSKRRSYRRALL